MYTCQHSGTEIILMLHKGVGFHIERFTPGWERSARCLCKYLSRRVNLHSYWNISSSCWLCVYVFGHVLIVAGNIYKTLLCICMLWILIWMSNKGVSSCTKWQPIDVRDNRTDVDGFEIICITETEMLCSFSRRDNFPDWMRMDLSVHLIFTHRTVRAAESHVFGA